MRRSIFTLLSLLTALALYGNSAFMPPPNDLCEGAITVACGDVVMGSNVDATNDSGDSFGGLDVWYRFIGTGDPVTFSTCASDYNTYLEIYTGTCDALSFETLNSIGPRCGSGQAEIVDFPTTLGVEYIILLDGEFGADVGNFVLEVCPMPPVNDLCENALPIACGQTVTGNNTYATNASGDAFGALDVWYRFTGTGELVTFSTCGDDDFDTFLAIFPDDCSDFTALTINDNACGSQSEIVEFMAEDGVDYLILVEGFDDTEFGNFSLSVFCQEVCDEPNYTLTLVLDAFPTETSWELRTEGGALVEDGGGYSVPSNTETEGFCLEPGECYDFTIFDAFGDGICCAFGDGSYTITDAADNVVITGGSFGLSETMSFCVPCTTQDPTPATTTKTFCASADLMPSLANTGINVSNSLSANEKVVWKLTGLPSGSAYAIDDEFTTDDCGDPFKNFGELAVANSSKVIRVQDVANAPEGTYTFDVFIEDCTTGCTSELVSGFSITVNAQPAVPTVNRLTRDACAGGTATVSVMDPGADFDVRWTVVAAPEDAVIAAGDVIGPGEETGEYRTNLEANGIRFRIKGNMMVVPGLYQLQASVVNTTTDCESELTMEVFEINIFEQPTVEITSDPDGDICLGTMGVQYNAIITSTDGGTYTYDWCAYNSGDGSGTCFGGFSDNTIQMPTRNWTSSAGPKSVGVTVASNVTACTAEALYSFNVDPVPMVECPEDQMVTLVTNPGTFECETPVLFTNPMVGTDACGPYTLTIAIDGGAPEMVTPGEEYTLIVEALGVVEVSYILADGLGRETTCSFDVIVDGLPCGLVDNGGIDCTGSTAMYDQGAASFSLMADCAPNTMLYVEDASAFVFTELCGDGEITAQVTGLSGTGFAGVMMRDSEAPSAKKVALGTNTVDRLRKEVRVIDGYPSSAAEIISFSQFWVRVVRSGDAFSAFASTDGVFWQPYISQVVIMEECIVVGLFTYSEKEGNAVTATFSDVSITGLDLANLGAPMVNLGAPIAIGVQGLRVYPNPAVSEITLDLANFEGQAADIRIINQMGQLLSRTQIEEVQLNEVLEVSQLNPGVYNIVVKVGTEVVTERLVIARP